MNRSIKIALVMVIITGLVLMFVSSRLSTKIEKMIRNDAVAVLGLGVELKTVDTQLARGTASISGLKIANPAGFPSPYIFDLSSIHVDISTLSLLPGAMGWGPYRVEEIIIQTPVVTVDVDEQGRTNLDVVSQRLQSSRQATTNNQTSENPNPTDKAATKPAPANDTASKDSRDTLARFTVDQLSIEGLSFNLNRAGKAPESGTLADIQMENLGGSDGVSAAGLGVKVSARLASEILAVVVMRKATERLDKRAEGLLNKLLRSSTAPTGTR